LPSNSAKRSPEAFILLALCAVFIALGWPFLKRMGIEVDEALVGNGLFGRVPAWYSWRLFGHEIPVMLLSYLGALKTWLCAPILAIWNPSAISVRLPTALLGAVTIALFWRLLKDVCGRSAAWVGAVLLTTDTTFLLLTTIDFGPVALQLFLKTAALVLFVRWHRNGRPTLFALAWFVLGLALWDKAVFPWIAAGLAAGALAAMPRMVRAAIRPRLVSIAAVAFCVGAFPLIVYNIARPLDTIRSNAKVSSFGFIPKLGIVRDTMDACIFAGFYTASGTPPQPGSLDRPLRRALAAVSAAPGTSPRNWSVWAFAGAILALPAIWHTRARSPALFGLVSFAGGWIAMALTSGGGVAAHHVALLWPMHLMVIAAVTSSLSSRFGNWIPVCIAAVLAITGLRCTAGYFVALVRNGPAIRWTDAINPLTDYLKLARPQRVFVVDWGILESVNLLSQGSVPVLFGDDYYSGGPEAARLDAVRRRMVEPGTLFVSHTPEYEQLHGSRAAVDKFAAATGYQKEAVVTIPDRFGRPTFDIFRFKP
jgi:hypothetical protein